MLEICTAEGEEATVFPSGPESITFNRFGGGGIMDLLAVLLRRLDAVLVVPGGPTVIQRDGDRDRLPAVLKDEGHVVAHTGVEIDRAIRAG
ncbi:hypothetical protein [Streptomyces sp. NPDC096351]|uniref:hypothetical protein n=1 Tax=Streptomyces sp. NPDC096351 TaxID=3366087 RepID=UPI00380BF1CD